MTAKRVLFLNTLGIIGGQEVVMLSIIKNLDRGRFTPVAASLVDGPLVGELRSIGVPTTVLPKHRIRQPHRFALALVELARILSRERIDVVHCNGDTLLLYGALAARWRHVPCVWHVYEPVVTGGSPYTRFLYEAQRRLRAAWTIFGTAAVEESYLRDYPELGPSSAIMPGVDVDELNRGADPVAARRALGIPDHAPILLLIARVQRSKGQRELVEAVAELRGAFAPPHVVFCGGAAVMTDEDYHDEVVDTVKRLGLDGRVHFTGHVPDETKKNLLAAATVLVHPAHREAFGIAVVEGMAAGKPVVVTDAIGPTSIVRGSGAGEIVKARDVAALAAALARRLENPEESREMGRLGQIRAREQYGVGKMVEKVEAVYRAVLADPSARGSHPAHDDVVAERTSANTAARA